MRTQEYSMRFICRVLSRLKRICSSLGHAKHEPSIVEASNSSTPLALDYIANAIDASEVLRPTSANTGSFISLPGEIRNLIYKFAFNTSFSHDQLPNTHLLPSCFSLALTCRQIYHEVHKMIDSNVLVYGLHTMRIRFYQQLAPEKLRLLKAVILPESRMGDSWIRYQDWSKGIYQCVVEQLCASKFHPTTLIFCTDFKRSQMTGHVSGISDAARDARFANALKDLRFALSILKTIRTAYIVDVGIHGDRDLYANMFEKFFPSDVDKVQRIAHGFNSLHYHGTLDSPEKWDVYRERQYLLWNQDGSCIEGTFDELLIELAANTDNAPDFRLLKAGVETPDCEVFVHIFTSWPDFCNAYDGPYRSPKRTGKPVSQQTATEYNMRQPSWHLGQDV